MPRLSFVTTLLAVALGIARTAPAQTSGHLRSGSLTRPCMACHRGHGVSRSPLLARTDDQLCLDCHSAAAKSPARKSLLGMGPSANPLDIQSETLKPYTHRGARCLDCHSAHAATHASTSGPVPGLSLGIRKGSPKKGFATETDLCLSCHGSRGPRGADVHDLRARLDPTNPSYHPLLATGRSASIPSLLAPLTTSSLINCSDCHTSESPVGARGPHGSQYASLLGQSYTKQDNQPESPTTYALCYACHDRTVVLTRDSFPLHGKHVSDARTPCRICHDPHGTTSARALIRFNEPTVITEVTPSSSGRLQFVSSGPGSGACYLTCHGKDHDPLGYGPGARLNGVALVTKDAPPRVPAAGSGSAPAPGAGLGPSGTPHPGPGPGTSRPPKIREADPKGVAPVEPR